jgi:acyl-CoA synthetase (AMP-forming)/AMP-acid ligase II
VDRIKDLLIRGGYNVYPGEIEEVLYQHPEVGEAAVIGIPDERLGEEVKAFVVPRPGDNVTTEDLISFLRERIAAYSTRASSSSAPNCHTDPPERSQARASLSRPEVGPVRPRRAAQNQPL